MKVMKAVEVMPGEAAKMVAEDGVDCAWQGCDSHFKGDKPAGWVNLLTWVVAVARTVANSGRSGS
jgi:hypothetical protein